ncbi:SurA N-terminal domain-containing protein [Salipaludibacillus aurantiacus]|uniref:peptidylprolyl isomerase n=1 Tax=Salipaludibacillus aurantiacus TaxID=1601833 RepID=A0A1H9S7Y3_9BACI|nr:SurA N-terminal domain-containing protein [Salipaludibacillus aurantiacus]SER80299.1 peptidyl-prolyl cis-trans isomerase SurA [Salipaludibacillus aurantiacus]
MNKKWLSAVSLAAAAMVMTACGDAEEGNNNTESETQEGQPAANNEAALEGEGGETAEQSEMPEPDLEGVPDVVAEVNGEEIPREEFEPAYEGQFQQAAMQTQMTGEEVDQEMLKEQVADNMVNTELLVQEAENEGYEATEEEIDETLEEIAMQSGLASEEEFLAALEEQGTDEEEVMSQVETQVKVDQLVASEAGDIEVTDEELEETYEQLEAQHAQMGQEGDVPSFEEVKPELEEQVRAEKEGQAAQEIVENLREDADVTIHL